MCCAVVKRITANAVRHCVEKLRDGLGVGGVCHRYGGVDRVPDPGGKCLGCVRLLFKKVGSKVLRTRGKDEGSRDDEGSALLG